MNYTEYVSDRYSDDNIRKLIPLALNKALKNYSFSTNTWCNGRTLQDAFSHISGAMYNLSPIFQLLSWVNPAHTTVKLIAAYSTYSATDNVAHYTNIVPEKDSEMYYNIYIKHIPKGTTFLTDALSQAETNKDLIRMKNVELQLIQDGRHFIRVYKSTNVNNSYAILTNWVDSEFLNKVMLLIPVIIGWPYHSESKVIAEPNEEIRTHYILENYIADIFTNLYDFYNNTINLSTFKENLTTIFNEIIALKDLDKLSFENFTNNLANIINTKLRGAVKNELDTVNSRITDAERNLEAYYSKKQMLTKNLFLIEKASPDDIKPFIDALKTTKAIEIIETDDFELRIRVTAPLQFFDTSDFKRYQQNSRSYYRELLDSNQFGNIPAIVAPIFDKIFITHEYKLLLQAVISIKADSSNYNNDAFYVSTNTYSYSGIEAIQTITPNPHHYYYNCWDKTKQQIRKAATEGNYDLIPTLIVNSVQTINVAENTSFHKLLRDLTEKRWRDKVHLIKKDGTELTWEQAIEIEKANYKSMSEPVEELVETIKEVTEIVEETVEQAEDTLETFVDTIEHTRDQLLEALRVQTTQEYTQVVIEEGDATPEDLEV